MPHAYPPHPPETQAALVADVQSGLSLSAASRKYKVSRPTADRWVLKAGVQSPSSALLSAAGIQPTAAMSAGVARQMANRANQERIGELVMEYLEQGLQTCMAIQSRVATDAEWLGKQNARDVAILYGVMMDKLTRVLSALRPAATDQEIEPGLDGDYRK